ncbi:MAG: sigma-70 family RNA polymerase sigma factor [Bacteroidota bacterium]
MAKTGTYSLKEEHHFEKIYKKYWKKLYLFSCKLTRDKVIAEEIVHDAFVALWRRKGDFDISIATEVYLVKTVKTKIVDHFRKRKVVEIKANDCKLCDSPYFTEAAIEHNLAVEKLFEEDLEIILNQLPCRCQEVYRLSRQHHLTTKEIALRLGISQKTVKNHLTKALSRIDGFLDL